MIYTSNDALRRRADEIDTANWEADKASCTNKRRRGMGKETAKKQVKKTCDLKAVLGTQTASEKKNAQKSRDKKYFKKRLKYLMYIRHAVNHFDLSIMDLEIACKHLEFVETDRDFAKMALDITKLVRDAFNDEIDLIREANGMKKVKHL